MIDISSLYLIHDAIIDWDDPFDRDIEIRIHVMFHPVLKEELKKQLGSHKFNYVIFPPWDTW